MEFPIFLWEDAFAMSRLDVALQRAASGSIGEPFVSESDLPHDAPHDRGDDARAVEMLARPDAPGAGSLQVERAATHEPPEFRFEAFHPSHAEKMVIADSLPPALREQFRRLGAVLHHAQSASGMKSLMISSAVPNEGKTLTATNIALTLSESYQRRVLLVDGDLRRPSLDEIFQAPPVFGLSEALTSEPEQRVSLLQISENLWLLPAGRRNSDPMSALTSSRMRRLLSEAVASFDWVVVDTPPVGILADANLLSSIVDAAILVVRAGQTPAADVQRAVDTIGRERILGIVLNRAEQPRASRDADAYYYSSSHATARRG
jgi:capsular exopolysaccharide synthesis family protein